MSNKNYGLFFFLRTVKSNVTISCCSNVDVYFSVAIWSYASLLIWKRYTKGIQSSQKFPVQCFITFLAWQFKHMQHLYMESYTVGVPGYGSSIYWSMPVSSLAIWCCTSGWLEKIHGECPRLMSALVSVASVVVHVLLISKITIVR